ncbi:hypothetical protein BJ508DRAFT_130441 [Ascobolus immersus RN42]|uniref:Uncharacterized protein n=1 Tax=Ascobolus immersus RN42 TaxID=1160509 RepID=A0A3N4I485_ASCIM|nr:hypothetical protein BJ508DRAFT_130441 [Ascobolus immersus RN42]
MREYQPECNTELALLPASPRREPLLQRQLTYLALIDFGQDTQPCFVFCRFSQISSLKIGRRIQRQSWRRTLEM